MRSQREEIPFQAQCLKFRLLSNYSGLLIIGVSVDVKLNVTCTASQALTLLIVDGLLQQLMTGFLRRACL